MPEGCGCSPKPDQIRLTFGGRTVGWELSHDEAAGLLQAIIQALGPAKDES